MELRIAGIETESIVDGPGYRIAVFTQGCPHRCPGCHNPQTHAMDGGRVIDTRQVIELMGKNPLVRGLTLTGGEPMMQPRAMLELAAAARVRGMNVWCYTGYTLEALMGEASEDRLALLKQIDVLVDGPFIAAQRSLELLYCGSRNQRLIDMQKTLAMGEICLYVPDAW